MRIGLFETASLLYDGHLCLPLLKNLWTPPLRSVIFHASLLSYFVAHLAYYGDHHLFLRRQ